MCAFCSIILLVQFDIKAYNSSDDCSAAHTFVAEFMIAVGEVAAALGVAHRIALPFRGQKRPNIPEGALENLIDYPSGPCTAAHYRSYMNKVEVRGGGKGGIDLCLVGGVIIIMSNKLRNKKKNDICIFARVSDFSL